MERSNQKRKTGWCSVAGWMGGGLGGWLGGKGWALKKNVMEKTTTEPRREHTMTSAESKVRRRFARAGTGPRHCIHALKVLRALARSAPTVVDPS